MYCTGTVHLFDQSSLSHVMCSTAPTNQLGVAICCLKVDRNDDTELTVSQLKMNVIQTEVQSAKVSDPFSTFCTDFSTLAHSTPTSQL